RPPHPEIRVGGAEHARTRNAASHHAGGGAADKADDAIAARGARADDTGIGRCTKSDAEHAVIALTSTDCARALNAFAPHAGPLSNAGVLDTMTNHTRIIENRYVGYIAPEGAARPKNADSRGRVPPYPDGYRIAVIIYRLLVGLCWLKSFHSRHFVLLRDFEV